MTTLLTPVLENDVGIPGIDDDVEPDTQFKESLRGRIEKELQSMADKVRQDRDAALRGLSEGTSDWDAVMNNYQASMDRLRRIAQEQFNHELKIARFERSLASGKEIEGEEFEAFRRQQQAIWDTIKKGGAERSQVRRDSTVVLSPNQENGVPPPSPAPSRPSANTEPDVREGPSIQYRDARPLARPPPGSEPRPRDRTQSGGSEHILLGTPGNYSARPVRSRGNSVFTDFDPTVTSPTPYDQSSIGRQGIGSLSRTKPPEYWHPSPSPKDNTSRTFAHATGPSMSPVSPNPEDRRGSLSRAGSIRSIERPSPVLTDYDPGSSLPRDRFGMGPLDDRSSSRKGKEPEWSDHQRHPSFTQQTATHDVYARRSDSRASLPMTPGWSTMGAQPSEDQYFPQVSPVSSRYPPDDRGGIPIRSSRRSVTSDQGSPENTRFGPSNQAGARQIPSKRSLGDFDAWMAQPGGPLGRPVFGPSPPGVPLAAAASSSSGRPIPRPSSSEDEPRRASPSSGLHGSQSPPRVLEYDGGFGRYRQSHSGSPAAGSGVGSVSVGGRRNSNGGRSVRSRSSRQEFWGPADVSQRPLQTYEEQSVASGSESDSDLDMGLDRLFNVRDRQELTWKLIRDEARRQEVLRKAEEAKRLEEEARRKQEEAWRKEEEARRREEEARRKAEEARQKEEEARRKEEEVRLKTLEIQQKQEELARREAELMRKEAEARLLEERWKREQVEALLQEEIRRREEAERGRARDEEERAARERRVREDQEKREQERREQEKREQEERERLEREERERRAQEEREKNERERQERMEREKEEQEQREKEERERREKEERVKREKEETDKRDRQRREKERKEKEKEEKERAAREEKERRQREREEKARREREEKERKEEQERRVREQKEREDWVRRQREEEERFARERQEWEETRKREAEAAAAAQAQAILEAERLAAQADARRRMVEAETQRRREEEARRQQELEAQRRREEEKRQQEAEAQRRREEEEAQRQRDEDLRRRQEAESRRQQAAEAEARSHQQAEASRQAELGRPAGAVLGDSEFQDPTFLKEQQAEFERIRAQQEQEAARKRAEAAKKREEDEARKQAKFMREQEEIYKRLQVEEQGRLREQESRKRAEEIMRKKAELAKQQEEAILADVLRRSEEEHRLQEERRRRQDSVGSISDSNTNRSGAYVSSSSSTPRPIPNAGASFHHNTGDRSSTASSSSFNSSASAFSASSARSSSTGYTSASSRASTTPMPSATSTPMPSTPHVPPSSKTGWKPPPSPATPSPTTPSSASRASAGAYHSAFGGGSPYAQSSSGTARQTASQSTVSPMTEGEWAKRQEEHARRQFEQFQREQEAQQRRAEQKAIRQLSKEDVIKVFEEHAGRWKRIQDSDILRWHSFPWPMLRPPTEPEQLTYIEIQAYVLSPHHPGEQAQKERVRGYLRKWHPDRFETAWLPRVWEEEREKVKEGAGTVTRHLNKLLSSLSESAENGLFG